MKDLLPVTQMPVIPADRQIGDSQGKLESSPKTGDGRNGFQGVLKNEMSKEQPATRRKEKDKDSMDSMETGRGERRPVSDPDKDDKGDKAAAPRDSKKGVSKEDAKTEENPDRKYMEGVPLAKPSKKKVDGMAAGGVFDVPREFFARQDKAFNEELVKSAAAGDVISSLSKVAMVPVAGKALSPKDVEAALRKIASRIVGDATLDMAMKGATKQVSPADIDKMKVDVENVIRTNLATGGEDVSKIIQKILGDLQEIGINVKSKSTLNDMTGLAAGGAVISGEDWMYLNDLRSDGRNPAREGGELRTRELSKASNQKTELSEAGKLDSIDAARGQFINRKGSDGKASNELNQDQGNSRFAVLNGQLQPAAGQRDHAPQAVVRETINLSGMTKPDIEREVHMSVVKNARVLSSNGGGEAKITLTPDSMGEITLQINTRGNRVDVMINASSAETKKALESNLSTLQSSLGASNLEVGKLEIAGSAAGSFNGFSPGENSGDRNGFSHGMFGGNHRGSHDGQDARQDVNVPFDSGTGRKGMTVPGNTGSAARAVRTAVDGKVDIVA